MKNSVQHLKSIVNFAPFSIQGKVNNLNEHFNRIEFINKESNYDSRLLSEILLIEKTINYNVKIRLRFVVHDIQVVNTKIDVFTYIFKKQFIKFSKLFINTVKNYLVFQYIFNNFGRF